MLFSLFVHVLSLCCVLHGTSCITAVHFVIPHENLFTLIEPIFSPSVEKLYCLIHLINFTAGI
jgi:hypothetical protein